MKFTVNEDFRHGRATFEEDNTYESTKHNLTNSEVDAFYNAGWIEVEGREKAPERKPGAVELVMEGSTHG